MQMHEHLELAEKALQEAKAHLDAARKRYKHELWSSLRYDAKTAQEHFSWASRWDKLEMSTLHDRELQKLMSRAHNLASQAAKAVADASERM